MVGFTRNDVPKKRRTTRAHCWLLVVALVAVVTPLWAHEASASPGTITTYAGNGLTGDSGDGGPATLASVASPWAVAFGGGNLYVTGSPVVRKINAAGTITKVAGNGVAGYSGDGGPAVNASLNLPKGLALDAAGNLFIADGGNNRIRKVDVAGTITTFAGTGATGFSGDGGPATSATFDSPFGLAFDAAGNLYIADARNGRIRKVTPAGTISTFVSGLNYPYGIAFDPSGNLYAAEYAGHRVTKITPTGTASVIAGTGVAGFAGDGGPALASQLHNPVGIAVDSTGNVYVGDEMNNRVRKIDPLGKITTAAGNGNAGYFGDGGNATDAWLNAPTGLASDPAGNVYIADLSNNRARKLETPGASCNGLAIGGLCV